MINFDQVESAALGKLVTVFLDYDGTLTPIVNDPDAAYLSNDMREAIKRVASLFPTAVISGRGREKVKQFVALQELYYAGSHGMDISGPGVESVEGSSSNLIDTSLAFQPAAKFEPRIRTIGQELARAIDSIDGAAVEDNKFCVSVHFRNCSPESYSTVLDAVSAVVSRHQDFCITRGRKVLEVRPKIEWNKGSALLHLLQMFGIDEKKVFCLYIGDDRTDEDAFQVLQKSGIGAGILVSTRTKATAARWTLRDPYEVAKFLNKLVSWGSTDANLWHGYVGCKGWRLNNEVAVNSQKNDCIISD